MMVPMDADQKKKIRKLRKRINNQNATIRRQEEEVMAQEAEDLKKVKVVTLYEDQKCVECGVRNAVGKGELCRRCGGDPVIRENLLKEEEIPDSVLAGSKYNPSYHPMEFLRLATEGLAEVEIAAAFNISVYTMRTWAEKFEHFNMAYEIGKAQYEAWWQSQGKTNLNNRSYNTGLFKYMTMNNLGWSDKIESKNLNVNAGVLVAPKQLDNKDWEKKYATSTDDG